jgi:DNA-binding GntR family transcriptional regulator
MTTETSAVLPGAIAEQLRARIIAQLEPPGSTITESAVAVRFGVARPTARIAIERLVADGILRREAHRAARVPQLDRDDILDLYTTRAIVEGAAAARLASGGTIPARALEAHRALSATDEFAPHDIAFHRSLVEGQDSPRLAHLHGLLMGEVELCIGQVQAAHLLTTAEVAAQHQGILDAITAGDAATAERLTREHIAYSRDALLTHLDRKAHG